MNISFKQLFKKKNLIIAVSMIVLIFIGLSAFFLNRERANVLLNEDTTSDTTNDYIFSSYEVYKDKIIKLISNNGSFAFIDNENNALYTTSDNVEYFRILDDTSLIYITSSINVSTNKSLCEVKLIDLNTKEESILHSGEKLFLEASNDVIYIIDALNGNMLYGERNNLKSTSFKKPISKVLSSKGRIFAINYTIINNIIRSTIYSMVDNNIEEVAICEGKVQSINVDYNNDNIIYYSSLNINSLEDTSSIEVYKKYLIDLSATSSGLEKLDNLESNVISIKDKYIILDTESNALYLLNSNFVKIKRLAYVNENILMSMIKESSDSECLYFIDKSGSLNKI